MPDISYFWKAQKQDGSFYEDLPPILQNVDPAVMEADLFEKVSILPEEPVKLLVLVNNPNKRLINVRSYQKQESIWVRVPISTQ